MMRYPIETVSLNVADLNVYLIKDKNIITCAVFGKPRLGTVLVSIIFKIYVENLGFLQYLYLTTFKKVLANFKSSFFLV